MKKAYGYIRVSSPGQAKDDKDGFPRQEEAIRKYAKDNKIEIVEIYKEPVCGDNLVEHRPEMAKMMVSLEKNGHEVKTVIVEMLERLARSVLTQEFIINDFQSKGYNLISTLPTEKDLCGKDPDRVFFRQIMGAANQYHKSMLVAKLWAAKERKRAKTGKYAGGRPSYKSTQEGQTLIRRIKYMRRKKRNGRQMQWQQIADTLNKEGIRTQDGSLWTLHRVQQIAKTK